MPDSLSRLCELQWGSPKYGHRSPRQSPRGHRCRMVASNVKIPFDNAPFYASSLLRMKSEGIFTSNRSIWLLYADAHCAFCSGHTEETSAFATGYRCCDACNDDLWPRQISLDAAINKYCVRPWDVEWPPSGLKLRRGRTVEVSGARVTISDFVLEEEMQVLRDAVHSGKVRFWWDKGL